MPLSGLIASITAEVFDRFRDTVVDVPQVAECHMVAGGFDYLLKLRLADMDDYRDVLARIVDLPGGAQTHTYMVIEAITPDSGIPLNGENSAQSELGRGRLSV